MNKWYRMTAVFFIMLFFFIIIAVYSKEIAGTYNNFMNAFRHSDTGKKLIIGRATDSISLDPCNSTDLDSVKVTVNIYETLVKYEKEDNKLVPCLAESWKSSEDGLRWVFRIRQGVKFHDGTTLDAHAVEFNFHRWMDVDNPYHEGQFEYWNYIFGGFPGFVKSVKAISNDRLEITLTKPYAPFLSSLAMPTFGITSPAAIKKYGTEIYRNPVGTGPFLFKTWELGKRIVLARNDNYWDTPAKVDEVEFVVIGTSKERLEQLKQGNILIADDLGPDDVDAIDNDPNLQLYLRPCFNIGYLALNNEKAPFDSRMVRLAINYAVNKEDMIKDVFANLAKPAKTYIPPLLWGYDENIEPYGFDPEKAKTLLTEAGYPNGFKTTLWVMNSPRNYFPKPLQVAEYIKKNLKQINIDVTIRTFNMDEYLRRIANGEHEMALIGWTGDNIDPDNFLNTLLASDNTKHGMASNYAFYHNPDVDRLLTQARQTNDLVFRKSLYQQLLRIVNYDVPNVPLVHTMPVLAGRMSVKGYMPFITGVESLDQVDFDIVFQN